MRKLILSFSLGAIISFLMSMMIKPLCTCQNEVKDLIMTKCQKMKDQMQSSMQNGKEYVDDIILDIKRMIDSIDEENLPNKVKKTLSNIRMSLDTIK